MIGEPVRSILPVRRSGTNSPETDIPNNPRKLYCADCKAEGMMLRYVDTGSQGMYFRLPEGWGVNKYDCETTLFVCPDCLP